MTTSATTAAPLAGTAPDHCLVPPLPPVRGQVAALRTGGAR